MAAIGSRSAIKFLLERGADVNAKTDSAETPMDVAVLCNLSPMVLFLRERGAVSNVTDRDDKPFHATERCVDLRNGRIKGEVAWYQADRGYGYPRDYGISGQGIYGELFFDRENIVGLEPDSIEEETDLSFEIAHDEFGLRAVHVEFGQEIRKLL